MIQTITALCRPALGHVTGGWLENGRILDYGILFFFSFENYPELFIAVDTGVFM